MRRRVGAAILSGVALLCSTSCGSPLSPSDGAILRAEFLLDWDCDENKPTCDLRELSQGEVQRLNSIVDDLWDSGVSECEQMGSVIWSHMTEGLMYGWDTRDQNAQGVLGGDYHLSGSHEDEMHLWNADSSDAVLSSSGGYEHYAKHEAAHVMGYVAESAADAAVAACTNS